MPGALPGPPPPPPRQPSPSPAVSPAGDEKSIAVKDDTTSEVKASLPLPFPGLGGLDLPGEAGAQMSKLYQVRIHVRRPHLPRIS